jgi:hypothetical protein
LAAFFIPDQVRDVAFWQAPNGHTRPVPKDNSGRHAHRRITQTPATQGGLQLSAARRWFPRQGSRRLNGHLSILAQLRKTKIKNFIRKK